MKKLKECYYDIISTVPERAFLEINKHIVASICVYVILFVLICFSHLWSYLLLLTATYLIYICLLIYEMYLFKKGEMVEISGVCTSIGKDIIPYNRSYIYLATGTEAYKVILRKNKNYTVYSI